MSRCLQVKYRMMRKAAIRACASVLFKSHMMYAPPLLHKMITIGPRYLIRFCTIPSRTSGHLCALYRWKPGLCGPMVSVCALGVSRGVHYITFSVLPDRFRHI